MNNKPLIVETPLFKIKDSKLFALLGKQTNELASVLKAIDGSEKEFWSGKIYLWGSTNLISERGRIGSSFEIESFKDEQSIRENLRFLAMVKELDYNDIDVNLKYFNLFKHKNILFKECTKNQKKRLAIICALLGNLELILLYEPLQFLTNKQMDKLFLLLEKTIEDERTVIICSSLHWEMLEDFCAETLYLKENL